MLAINDEFWKEFNEDNFEAARAAVERMGQISKAGKEFIEGSTRILMRTGVYENAKPALKHCLQLYPTSKSCRVVLVDAELSAGTRTEQMDAAHNCLKVSPANPHCLNDLAIIRMHEGKFSDAVTIYQKLIETNGSYGMRFNLNGGVASRSWWEFKKRELALWVTG